MKHSAIIIFSIFVGCAILGAGIIIGRESRKETIVSKRCKDCKYMVCFDTLENGQIKTYVPISITDSTVFMGNFIPVDDTMLIKNHNYKVLIIRTKDKDTSGWSIFFSKGIWKEWKPLVTLKGTKKTSY